MIHIFPAFANEKETVMDVISRILGVSAVMSGAGTWLGYGLFGPTYTEWLLPGLVLGCVGGLIGAIAGAAREIIIARRE